MAPTSLADLTHILRLYGHIVICHGAVVAAYWFDPQDSEPAGMQILDIFLDRLVEIMFEFGFGHAYIGEQTCVHAIGRHKTRGIGPLQLNHCGVGWRTDRWTIVKPGARREQHEH